MARKLREALGMVNANSSPVEPELQVPTADNAEAWVKKAEGGFAAITELYVDRNRKAEAYAKSHAHNIYLFNVNNALRQQVHYLQYQRDVLIQANARLGAYLAQARDLFGRIDAEIGQATAVLAQMPEQPNVTNNPDMPKEPEPIQATFDSEGMLIEKPAPTIEAAELRKLIDSLNATEAPKAEEANSHAS